MKLYVCEDSHFPNWHGAPVYIVEKIPSLPGCQELVEIEHALTGESYVTHRHHVVPAKPGLIEVVEMIPKIRNSLKQLLNDAEPLIDLLHLKK
jgi:hypothetical protein